MTSFGIRTVTGILSWRKPRLYSESNERDRRTVQYLLVTILRHMLELLHPFHAVRNRTYLATLAS